MARDILGILEYEVLSLLLHRPGNSYGAAIQERISERIERDVSIGAVHTALDRLEEKGFVSSWWGEPSAIRGGRRKRYYKVEASGIEAVRRSEAAWNGLRGGLAREGL